MDHTGHPVFYLAMLTGYNGCWGKVETWGETGQ